MDWITIPTKETFATLSKTLFLREFYFIPLVFNCSFKLVSFVFSFFTLFSSVIL